jgi:hypothetical protein
MSKINVVVVDLQNSLKEVKGVEVSEMMVVDFLNGYIDESLATVADFRDISSESVLNELYDYYEDETSF